MAVLLIDGESLFSPPVTYCLAAARRTVYVGSTSRFPDVRFSRFARKFRWWNDESQLLDDLIRYARGQRVDVIMACSDPGIRFLSRFRRELEMSAPVGGTSSVDSLDIAADKARFAQFLSEVQLPHPETVALQAGEPLPHRLPGFPALLKPARGSGGELIARFDERAVFEHFAANGGLGTRCWILQTYVEGRDIDCSVMCRDGKILAYTVQQAVRAPAVSFQPIGAVEFVKDDEVLELARRLVAALQWTGIAHIDMLKSQRDGRVYVSEVNGRYWSSLIGSYLAGVNFPELACLDALGQPFHRPTQRYTRFVRGSIATALREARNPAETTLSWRISDPGPLLACYARSCFQRLRPTLQKSIADRALAQSPRL